MKRLLMFLIAMGGLFLGIGIGLDRWQPLAGSPDAISRRFLAGLSRAPTPQTEPGYRLVAESGCVLCHTTDLGGGRLITGPNWHGKTANISPDVSGLNHGDVEVLINALRKGIDDDGAALPNRAMPWDLIGHFSDAEIRSIHDYLETVPKVQRGNAWLRPGGTKAGEIHLEISIPPPLPVTAGS